MISIEQITYINEIGQRQQLEDSIYPPPGKAMSSDKLFLVCDGVGGEHMGEQASRIACEGFAHFIDQNPPPAGPLTSEYINGGQQYVLQQMRTYAQQYPEAQKMSTTLTLAFISGNNVSIAWCGDSRVYHLRNGEVLWHSSDHSLVANLVKHGEITEQEARRHPQRNIITRALSASGAPSEIDSHVIADLQDGDYIMLCTDGVLEQISEERLKQILKSNNKNKKELFMEYCEDLTNDNFSLYLLKLNNDTPWEIPSGKKRRLIPILLSVLFLLILAVVFKDEIKSIFKSSKDNRQIAVPKKSAAKPEAEKPSENSPQQLPAKDSIAPVQDTGKGLSVSVSGKRIKIKATITKVKKTVPKESKKIAARDSSKTDVAPPQNLD